MQEESLSRRLTLMVVDKLLIGVAALIVVFFFEARQREAESIRQEGIRVAGVMTSVLTHEQNRIMENVAEFRGLVAPYRAAGSVHGEADRARLGILEEEIFTSVAVVEAIDREWRAGLDRKKKVPCNAEDRASLPGLARATNSLVPGLVSDKGIDSRSLNEGLERMLDTYVGSLGYIRCLSVNLVREEVAYGG